MTPVQLVEEARRRGLDAVCVTEHNGSWERWEAKKLAEEHNFIVLRGIEVSTDLGHILTFGVDRYMTGMYKAKELRKIVNDHGGFMIVAHPMKGFPKPGRSHDGYRGKTPTIEEAARFPVFEYIDDIEVYNGACSEFENLLAFQVAKYLGKQGTGGSDTHSMGSIGRYTTVFENDEIRTVEDLVRELKAGRFHHGVRPYQKSLLPQVDWMGDGAFESIDDMI